MKIILSIFSILLFSSSLYAQEIKWENPVIKKYGKIVAIPGATEQPDKNLDYKILINIIDSEKTVDGINKGLDMTARTVNLFASAGIDPKKLDIIALIHRKATPIVMKQDNQNSEIIHELKKVGVKIIVCGQALAGYNIQNKDVNSDVTIALSAITAMSTYQLKGYSIIPN